jgi:integrase
VSYLSTRGSTYYFRMAIPADVRDAIGKREFVISLGTKERQKALRLLPAQIAAAQRQIDSARASVAKTAFAPPASPTARSLAAAEHEQWRFENEMAGAEAVYEISDAQDERRAAREPLRVRKRRLLSKKTVDLTENEAADKDVWEEARAQGATEASASRQFIVEPSPVPIAKAVSGEGVMLDTTIVDLWAAERKPADRTKANYRRVAEWFYERAGKLSVELITRKHVLAFKDWLIEDGQTPANTNVKIGNLRTLLQWAVDNDYASENAARGISVKAPPNRRRSFDLSALNAVFGGPVHTRGARPSQGRGEAAYWIPLLALYTGARLEEIGQLRVSDVRQISYPDAHGDMQQGWFLSIIENTDEEGQATKLKNDESERLVPVHPEIERLGFIAYVQALEDRKGRVFPLLKPGAWNVITAKWGEWFGRYLRQDCKVTDRRIVFHSFRHTFKDYARSAGIDEGIQRQIMGHSSQDVADNYGSGFPLHRLVSAMASYRVPGLAIRP